jgi:hypothetical protein
VPIRVAAGAGDRFFPASFQQAVAKDRLGLQADIVPGGHLNALCEPTALTNYLLTVTDRQPPIQQRWATDV